ncbi:hypothetical protein SAMN05444920_1456 [Nonomuraea solani]|uniref:Uncharacterized protein n=1 Tax=Nonomuraea solani TaxID=1144553 RepID=A0A1H6F3Y2_9ACTN|nr:hypothetical protein [Nonomuraea solani]SEH03826.1 hypothetical protein SAMN05444920_1456 [Nonomuraea solani]
MIRRVLAPFATAAFACLGVLAVSAAPAQAAPVEIVYSPLSLGDYCSAKVDSSSAIGFYSGGVSCYRRSTGGSGLTYTGSGSASAACAHFNPTYTLTGYAQGASQALICKYSV